MKDDIVAANLSSLREEIKSLKALVEQSVSTEQKPKTRQTNSETIDKATLYNSVTSAFTTCWNETFSVVKRRIWKEDEEQLSFSEWLPKLIKEARKYLRVLCYIAEYQSLLNRLNIEDKLTAIDTTQQRMEKKLDEHLFLSKHPVTVIPPNINGLFVRGRHIRLLYVVAIGFFMLLCTVLSVVSQQKHKERADTYYGMYIATKQYNVELQNEVV